MEYFLTSNPFASDHFALSERNALRSLVVRALPSPARVLFACSDPDDHAGTDRFADAVRTALEDGGARVESLDVLDARTAARANDLVAQAHLVVLAGGHVPTQNAFFLKIGLRDLMRTFDGVVIGISAGSMNAADEVYALPELPGEACDPTYRRFLPGLGLTDTQVLPHYGELRDAVLDDLRVCEDVACPDSVGRAFVALPDGSFLHGRDDTEEICGEAYVIADGWIRQVCSEDKRVLSAAATMHALESDPGRPDGEGGLAMLDRMNGGAHERLATWGLGFLDIPEKASMLDVGCGGGANLLRLLSACPSGHVTGIDHSETSVEASRRHCAEAIARDACEVEQGDVLDLRFPDYSFDVATAFETVYFWPDVTQGFREVLRTLAPGGSFMVCNDDDGTSSASHEFARTIEGMSVYTADQIASLMEEAGFANVETHHHRGEGLIAIVGRRRA